MYIETWSQFVNEEHLIDEAVKLAVAFFEDGKIRSEIFRCLRMFVTEMLANRRRVVGFTQQHLHQCVDEHRHTSSSIGKHFRDKHSLTPKDLTTNFTILKKFNSKFDCLIYEMFFINKLRPSLNVQCDSIRAKVFK